MSVVFTDVAGPMLNTLPHDSAEDTGVICSLQNNMCSDFETKLKTLVQMSEKGGRRKRKNKAKHGKCM